MWSNEWEVVRNGQWLCYSRADSLLQRWHRTSSDTLGLSKNKCVLGPTSGVLTQESRMNPEQTEIMKMEANDAGSHHWLRATKLRLRQVYTSFPPFPSASV